MHFGRSILVLASATFPAICWASAGPHSENLPDAPLPPCSQSLDNRDTVGPRHSNYFLCDLSNGAQALAANSTPPRIDARHLFNIDWDHYPEESKIKREEGWCVVSFTVGKDGHIDHASTKLERSSDSVLLDFACLQAFRDGQVVPATLHGRTISQRVGAVAVWAIEGPVSLRPKEHKVDGLCTKDSSVLPNSMVPPVNGHSLLTAGKLATDKGWLLDPCFYRDDALKQFFGATKIDRFYTAKDQGRWEGINLAVPGSVFGHSGPGMLSVGLTVVFLPSGIQRAELSVDNTNQVMPPAVHDDVVKFYGEGKSGIDETTDGGPTFETLEYNSAEGIVHTRSLFVFYGNLLNDTIVTVERVSPATLNSRVATPTATQPRPVSFLPLPTESPPGDLKYIVTDLDVFDDGSGSSDYFSLLQQQMHALECCATDIPKLFSGYRLQVRGYRLATWLPSADQDFIAKVLDQENPPMRAVNRQSEAVGTFSPSHSDEVHGYLLRGGKLTDIGTLGGRGSEANAINNCGQIAGASQVMFDSGEHVFVYQGGVMKDLGPGHANAINDRGQVAGMSHLDIFAQRAALWIRGKRTVLCEDLSEAFAINSAGAVVGECYDSKDEGQPHAFLYQNGKRIDLRDYIVHPRRPGVRGTDTVGAGINDAGQIIAYEYEIPRPSPSDEIAYLLTPVTSGSLQEAAQSVSLADRDLWLSRCNRLIDVRHIANEDRQRFLDLCMESSALPYLKHHQTETRSKPASCVSIRDFVPAKVEGTEIPYSVRIPVNAERFIRELSKLATFSQPADAARQLGQGLHATLRRHRSDDRIFYKLEIDARWKAELSLWSEPSGGWSINAGGRFGHDQLVFLETGKPQCLRIDLVDRVLTAEGFKRSDLDMPLAGAWISWDLNRSGTAVSFGGAPGDQCLPALRMVARKESR